MPKNSFKAKRHTARTNKRSAKRRQSLKSALPAARQPLMWLGNRRPAIAPKSNELILVRLEHNKDETKRILPRPERGMKVLALNGRVIEYRRTA